MRKGSATLAYVMAYDTKDLGRLMVASDGTWVTASWFERDRRLDPSQAAELVRRDDVPVLVQARQWLDRYFAGERPKHIEIPLHLTGSGFAVTLWTVMQELAYGRVVSSEALSVKLELEVGATRPTDQIEAAVAECPAALFVPSHRIVDAAGRLVGRPAEDATKRALLAHEGVDLSVLTER